MSDKTTPSRSSRREIDISQRDMHYLVQSVQEQGSDCFIVAISPWAARAIALRLAQVKDTRACVSLRGAKFTPDGGWVFSSDLPSDSAEIKVSGVTKKRVADALVMTTDIAVGGLQTPILFDREPKEATISTFDTDEPTWTVISGTHEGHRVDFCMSYPLTSLGTNIMTKWPEVVWAASKVWRHRVGASGGKAPPPPVPSDFPFLPITSPLMDIALSSGRAHPALWHPYVDFHRQGLAQVLHSAQLGKPWTVGQPIRSTKAWVAAVVTQHEKAPVNHGWAINKDGSLTFEQSRGHGHNNGHTDTSQVLYAVMPKIRIDGDPLPYYQALRAMPSLFGPGATTRDVNTFESVVARPPLDPNAPSPLSV